MPTSPPIIDELLDPISADRPAGEDLRWTQEWDRIREARRADEALNSGKWEKRERKTAEWPLVQQLASAMLQTRSKDLQLAMWLTEANTKLQGFPGLRDGLHLVRELMVRFWDAGLFPPVEDGPQDRSGPFDWMNEKLVDAVVEIPITRHSDGNDDYNLLNLRDARLVGSEKSWKTADGDILDENKKKAFDAALAAGRISLDLFRAAARETKRADFEELSSEFHDAYQEFKELESLIEQKFGDTAPSLKDFRGAMNDIKQELSDLLEEKRKQEPNVSPVIEKDNVSQPLTRGEQMTIRMPLTGWISQAAQSAAGTSWQEAERLVRSGEVDTGLAEMIRLAANETSGRNRFQRKLLLAEVCLASKRERLARAILEELAEQIDKFQLENWETSDVIAGVWTRLYELYKRGGDSSDAEHAAKLYGRLCRLDPWQALTCAE
ncbi:MAG: type VI secretion system protein TssA [Bryobacteraceae bacterium]